MPLPQPYPDAGPPPYGWPPLGGGPDTNAGPFPPALPPGNDPLGPLPGSAPPAGPFPPGDYYPPPYPDGGPTQGGIMVPSKPDAGGTPFPYVPGPHTPPPFSGGPAATAGEIAFYVLSGAALALALAGFIPGARPAPFRPPGAGGKPGPIESGGPAPTAPGPPIPQLLPPGEAFPRLDFPPASEFPPGYEIPRWGPGDLLPPEWVPEGGRPLPPGWVPHTPLEPPFRPNPLDPPDVSVSGTTALEAVLIRLGILPRGRPIPGGVGPPHYGPPPGPVELPRMDPGAFPPRPPRADTSLTPPLLGWRPPRRPPEAGAGGLNPVRTPIQPPPLAFGPRGGRLASGGLSTASSTMP